MKIDAILPLVLAGLFGVVLAILYFSGLWLTIKSLRASKHLPLLLAGSFFLRLVLLMGGFYLVSDGRIERFLLCLAMFLLTRLVFIKYIQPSQERRIETHGNQP